MKILQNLFSVKNEDNHKVIRILGFKLKFNNTKKILESKIDDLIQIQVKNAIKQDSFLEKQDILINQCSTFDFGFDKLYGIVGGVKYSPFHSMLSEAHEQTMDFIKQNMDLNKILFKINRLDNLSYSVEQITLDGLILEFGVFSGQTINLIADKLQSKTIYGFDSFEGIPDNWAGMNLEKGAFKRNDLPIVRNNVTLVKGWFFDTLPAFLNEHAGNIAFLHVDSDVYSSAAYLFDTLADRIVAGTIITFDEYFNFPNWQQHEYKAFKEFCEKYSVKFEYLSVGHDQVTVKILEKR